jgi:2-hydroxy-3-keto-5-methylthiopentenyl-1-phosphate phosphatase
MFNFFVILNKDNKMGNCKSRIGRKASQFMHKMILCGLCMNDVEIAMTNIMTFEKEMSVPPPTPESKIVSLECQTNDNQDKKEIQDSLSS